MSVFHTGVILAVDRHVPDDALTDFLMPQMHETYPGVKFTAVKGAIGSVAFPLLPPTDLALRAAYMAGYVAADNGLDADYDLWVAEVTE